MTRKYFDEVDTNMLKAGNRNYECGCKIIEIHEETNRSKEFGKTQVLVEACKEHDKGLRDAEQQSITASKIN